MKRSRFGMAFVLMNACLLLVTGCSSPPTRFYVLSTLPDAASIPSGAGKDVAVGVGPLELPDYLDRPQIVTRSGQNELNLAEFDNWAEPLKDNATQVLAENLAVLLPSKKIATYPWKRSTPIDFQVAVKVTRFDHTQGGETVLSTRWSILSGDGGKELVSRESRYRERPSGDSYNATVAAMNRALALFSRDVADAIIAQTGDRLPPR
ncbi:MAG TPA: PqiC family protein [Methylococcaceae bacterium]|nr:PqiC family protein [Methylococcaceae bacterium]